MLTELEMRVILQIYCICCKVFTIPFSWHNGQFTKKISKSQYSNWLVWVLTVLTVTFRISRVPPAIRRGDANAAIFNGISVVEGIYHLASKVNIWVHQDEFRELIEQVQKMNSIWGSNQLNREYTSSNIREKIFLFTVFSVVWGVFLSILLSVLTLLYEPDSIYEFLKHETNLATANLAFSGFILIETSLLFDHILTIVLTNVSMYITYFSMSFWLRKTCTDGNLNPSESTLNDIYRCILQYKALYILNTKCNLVFGKIVLTVIKLVLMVTFTASFFTLFRLYKYLNPLSICMVTLVYWTAFLLLIPLTIVMTSVYGTSKKFIRIVTESVCKLGDAKQIIKLQLNSCNLIRCKVGELYYMESKAKLTVVHKVVNGFKYMLVNIKVRG